MIDWIKNQVRKGNYQLKVHAIERASLRGIDPLDVKEALLNGRGGTDFKSVPKIHDTLWIITVYEPDPEEWIGAVERRRKQ